MSKADPAISIRHPSIGLRMSPDALGDLVRAAGPIRFADTAAVIALDGGRLRDVDLTPLAEPPVEARGLVHAFMASTAYQPSLERFVGFLDATTRFASHRERRARGLVHVTARGATELDGVRFAVHYVSSPEVAFVAAVSDERFAAYADAMAAGDDAEEACRLRAVPRFVVSFEQAAPGDAGCAALGLELLPYVRFVDDGEPLPLPSEMLHLVERMVKAVLVLLEHGEDPPDRTELDDGPVTIIIEPRPIPWARVP